jgi:pimeloyl-ACP methyl ester carboxylesterase
VPQAQANGLTIEYETFGDPADPPVLLIMGLGAQMTVWPEGLCEMLAERGLYVIRFDNRDIGLTTHFDHLGVPDVLEVMVAGLAGETIEAPYSLADMGDDAVGLLDALGIDTAHVVGGSMGGMIAQRIAIDHPDRLRSLTSIFSMPRVIPGDPEVMEALARPDPGTREGRIDDAVAAVHLFAGGGFPVDEDEERQRIAASIDRSWHPDGQARQMVAVMADGDRTEALGPVTTPTLVIHGTGDRLVVPAGGQETADAIPGAELVWIEGMGHRLPEGAWPQVVDPISALVARVEG